MTDLHNPRLSEAILKRDAFLKEFPHMLVLQDKIDEVLSHSGNDHNRLALISNMMLESAEDLKARLAEVSKELKDVADFLQSRLTRKG